MHELHVERHTLKDKTKLSRDMAYHMYAMHIGGMPGRITVAAQHPGALCAEVRQEWSKLTREVREEFNAAMDESRRALLRQRLAWMRSLVFTTKHPDDPPKTSVSFAPADDLTRTPPLCGILYVTYDFSKEKLHMMTSWMAPQSPVIVYEAEPQKGKVV